MDQEGKKPWTTDVALKATMVFLTLQLTGCAVDMVEPQATVITLFCLATFPENEPLEWAGLLVWFVLTFSWIVGAIALKVSNLRPIYWGLLLCIPAAFAVHNTLLNKEVFSCDAP